MRETSMLSVFAEVVITKDAIVVPSEDCNGFSLQCVRNSANTVRCGHATLLLLYAFGIVSRAMVLHGLLVFWILSLQKF
jgi:hypothetical protein